MDTDVKQTDVKDIVKAFFEPVLNACLKNNEKKEEEKEIENEKTDKRKLIDEVGGILKGKVDDEIIRTIIGKMEKASYEKSEAGTADNEKVKNEDDVNGKDEKEVKDIKEDVKKDVENKKCENSVENAKEDYFEKLNKIYNSTLEVKQPEQFTTREDRLKDGLRF